MQRRRRLNALLRLAQQALAQSEKAQPIAHIWDCCCDHGWLGTALLQSGTRARVHFVDTLPALTDKLSESLSLDPLLTNQAWSVHCQDAAELPLSTTHGRQLVIIAGVGGELSTRLVESISQRHPEREIDFLLCPVHHQYTLRQRLISLGYRLVDEQLLEEKRRFYEIILSRKDPSLAPLSPIGSQLWHAHSTEHYHTLRRYLNNKRQHYQHALRSQSADQGNQAIAEAYAQITLQPPTESTKKPL